MDHGGGAVADLYGYNTVFFLTAAMLTLAGVMVAFGVQEKFDPHEGKERRRSPLLVEWGNMLAIPGVLVTFLMRFSTSLGRMMIVPIIPLFIQTLLVDLSRLNTLTGLVQGIASGATTLSAVFLGRLGDRVGYRKVLVTCMALLGGAYALQGFVSSWWQLLILQGAVGLVMSGVLASISALLATLAPEGRQGAVYGVDASIVSAANAVGPMLGASVAATAGLRAPFPLTAGGLALAAGLVWLLVPKHGQEKSSTTHE